MPSAQTESQQPSTADEPVDYFSSLPPELLCRIFELAYAKSLPEAPLSKTLLPFHLERVYNKVTLGSYNSLERFAAHISTHRDRGKLVKMMRFGCSNFHELGVLPPDRHRTEELLAALPNLKSLELAGISPLVSLVLEPAFASEHLCNLSALSLYTPFLNTPFPLDPANFTSFTYYPSLVYFAFRDFISASDPIPRQLSSLNLGVYQQFDRLSKLELFSTSLDAACAQHLLSGCRNLRDLEITDASGRTDLVELVKALPTPSLLRTLVLRGYPEHPEDQFRGDSTSILRGFPRLTLLSLAGPYSLSSSFWRVLPANPHIQGLILGPTTLVEAEDVLAFFRTLGTRGPLRFFYLSNVTAQFGQRTDPSDEDDVWCAEDSDEPVVPPGWERPRWPPGWNNDVVEQIREAALKLEIEIQGSTFVAGEVERAYVFEEDKVERVRALIASGEWEWDSSSHDGSDDAHDGQSS